MKLSRSFLLVGIVELPSIEGPRLVDTAAGCRRCTATQPGSGEAKVLLRYANPEWSYPIVAHVTRGKVWAARSSRLRYVLNPREIESSRGAPAVQIYPRASELSSKCFSELGNLREITGLLTTKLT